MKKKILHMVDGALCLVLICTTVKTVKGIVELVKINKEIKKLEKEISELNEMVAKYEIKEES